MFVYIVLMLYICSVERNKSQTKKTRKDMKTLRFNTEKETEAMVIELTIKGVRFITTGRTEIVVFE